MTIHGQHFLSIIMCKRIWRHGAVAVPILVCKQLNTILIFGFLIEFHPTNRWSNDSNCRTLRRWNEPKGSGWIVRFKIDWSFSAKSISIGNFLIDCITLINRQAVRLGEYDTETDPDCIIYEDDKDCADSPIDFSVQSTFFMISA